MPSTGFIPVGLASPDLTLVINDRHAQRLTHLLGEALDMGARLVTGGPSRGRRILPTVIEAVTPEMGLDRDEIFGPILPLLIYDDLPDALARIAARPKPLALYVFEKDRGLVEQVIAGSTGSVGVNLTMLQFSHLVPAVWRGEPIGPGGGAWAVGFPGLQP